MLYTQPQAGRSQIDTGNPLTRGLERLANAGLATAGGLIDCVDPSVSYTSASPSLGTNTGGKSVGKNTATKWVASKTHTPIGTGDFTIFAQGIDRSNNTNQFFVGVAPTNVTGTIQLGFGSLQARLSNFNGTAAQLATNDHVPGALECLVAARRSGVVYFYLNGVFLGSASYPSTVANAAFVLGGADQGEVNVAGLYPARGLSDAEALSLSANIYQLILDEEEEDETVLFAAAAGGGTQSYTYTPSGGIVFAGASAVLRNTTKTPAGGLTFAGSASQSRQVQRTPSGGITLGGAASVLRSVVRAASGGILFSGAASVSFYTALQQLVVTPAGGIILAGTAAVVRTGAKIVAGGISFAGSAGVVLSYFGATVGNWIINAMRRRRE